MKVKACWANLLSRSGTGLSNEDASTRAASSGRSGSSPSLRPRALWATVGILVPLIASALLTATASADGRIGQQGNAAGDLSSPSGLAISQKEGPGDIYVGDTGFTSRVAQFEPGGAWVRAFGWGIVPGAATGTGNLTKGSSFISNVVLTSGTFWGGAFQGPGKLITGAGIPPGTTIKEVTSVGLELSEPVEADGTNVPLTVAAGPGNIPTNEIDKLTVAATGGEYTLTFFSPEPNSNSFTTANIPAGAPASGSGSVQEALEDLSSLGAGNVAVSGGPGNEKGEHPYLIEFKSRYADANLRELSATNLSLSGGNPSPSVRVSGQQQGGGVLETCTTVCLGETVEEGRFGAESGTYEEPGRFWYSDAIAVNNDASSGAEYGDVYVVDQRHWRVEKYSPTGQFELMLGGQVDKTKVAEREEEEANSEPITVSSEEENVCTAAEVAAGDECGAGVPGTGSGYFKEVTSEQRWSQDGSNSIAVGPDGTVYVGDYRRVQEFEPNGAYKGELTLPNQQFVSSLAIDSESHVFALSQALNERQRVAPPGSGSYEICFESVCTAPLSSEAGEGVVKTALEGLSTIGAGNVNVSNYSEINHIEFVGALAHANQPPLTVSAGSASTEIEGANSDLAKLAGPEAVDPSEVLQTYDTAPGSEPTHVALGEEGDVYVSDFNNNNFQFRGFEPDGALNAVFTSDQVETSFKSSPADIAIGNGNLYASAFNPEGAHIAVVPLPVSGPPVVEEERADSIEPKTATVHGIVNPSGYDTHYRFQYITEEAFQNDGGSFGTGTEETTLIDLGLINQRDPVQAAISGLTPGTVYHFRVVAQSSEGTTNGVGSTFESLPAVSVRDFTTETVGPELVKLKAEVNPNGQFSTYTIHYGKDLTYGEGASQGSLPVGNEFEKITATFEGLQPNTTYHYQLEAVNDNGESETTDQTFTTEHSAAELRLSESCPNTNLREENQSMPLLQCRAYEQVSPAYKAGYGVTGFKFNLATDGERVSFTSNGAFAGNVQSHSVLTYLAHRTEDGWQTEPVLGRPNANEQPVGPNEFSPDLRHWLFPTGEGSNWVTGNYNSGAETFYRGTSGAGFAAASPALRDLEGGLIGSPIFPQASADLSRLILLSPYRVLASDPRPGVSDSTEDRIYAVDGAAGPSPTVSLLAEVPLGLETNKGCEIDARTGQAVNIISADGSTVFYEAPLELVPGGACDGFSSGPNKDALFARVGEAPPIQVSAALPSECTGACASAAIKSVSFYGAAPDGSQAWFTTEEPRVNSDTDNSTDLYLSKIQNGSVAEIVQASHGNASDPTPGTGAGVQGVVRVSRDGSTAYFVATGVLTTEPNGMGQEAIKGADNLYAFDSNSDETKFVARLCSGAQLSGSVADTACGANLNEETSDRRIWGSGEGSKAQVTGDGRYLLLESYAQLTPDDTDNAADLYRYDLTNGEIIRVSIGRNGNDGNGNDDSYGADIRAELQNGLAEQSYETGTRAIAEDGTTVVFTTDAPLVSQDTNETTDLYEWHNGEVSAVSSGLDPHGTAGGMISPSGRDITFPSSRSFSPADIDGVSDVYDARIDGGFHAPHPESPCGSPEGCRNAVTPPPPTPNFTTESNVSGGNGVQRLRCAKGKVRVKRHGQVRCVLKHKKRHKVKRTHKAKHGRAGSNRRGGE